MAGAYALRLASSNRHDRRWGMGPRFARSKPVAPQTLRLFSLRQVHEDRGGDHRGPQPVAVADRRLRYVAGGDDFVRHAPDVLALVVTDVGVEVDAQNRRQHGGGQVLRVIPGLLVGFAEAMMLGEVAVMSGIGRDRATHRSGDQAMRLVGRGLVHDPAYDLPGRQTLES